jgi:predicted metal-dependent HD superfamily phosphohydrolase
MGNMMIELKARWFGLCDRVHLKESADGGWQRLAAAYVTPPRAYHCLRHISDCLTQLDRWDIAGVDLDSVEMALWWHDAIYDSRAKDNERQSAEYWRDFASGGRTASKHIDEVVRLIQATDHRAQAADAVGKLIQDVDLSIVGRAPEVFSDYERKIRDEYSWVSAADYANGRSEFLSKLITRDRLFLTDFGFHHFESIARGNIEKSLSCLKG